MPIQLPKFTFINGPAGSGKSTLASLLCDQDPSIWKESFAEPIRQMIYGVFFPEQGPITYDLDLRSSEVKAKDFPFDPEDNPYTYRGVMISFSEDWMKPKFGDDIFGRLALRRIIDQEMFYNHFLFDDCGFTPEVEHIVKMCHPSECLLIRLHREGRDFTNDSRSYITLPEVHEIDLSNDEFPEDMLSNLELELGL